MLEILLRGAQQLGISLTAHQAEQFQVFYEQLVAWNEKVNLTSITAYEAVQLKHFLDSLSIVPIVSEEPWSSGMFSMIDVGTGGGFPGIPLKIVIPRTRTVLLESVRKKTVYLEYLVDTLALADITVVTGRAEEVARQPEYREKVDLVVARALGKLASLAELTLPFCREGGMVVAPKKGDINAELERSVRPIELLGGRLEVVKEVGLEGLENHRLVVIQKVAVTPDRYPRRAGIPAKRPL